MPRILLVEDETAIAETVLYALRAEGFEAEHCLTGGQALRRAREQAFDLAVLDVGLPDIGGFALCRELRRDADLPVIFLTAQGAEADRIIGVLTIAKPNSTIAPFIERSQAVVMRWGIVLMGVALLVGLVAAWWLSRQLGNLRRYANAVTAGERATVPDAAGEFGELGSALETMRGRLEGKQYVEQYVHTLTHEMKSPLAAIRGSAELLDPATGDPPMAEADRARFVASIRAQSERLAQMIDKMLALAAVEHRQRLENPEAVDLADVVREAAEQCAHRLSQRGLQLQLEVGEEPLTVSGDAFLLRQAVINLIDNAADFSRAHGIVELRLRPQGDTVHMEAVSYTHLTLPTKA